MTRYRYRWARWGMNIELDLDSPLETWPTWQARLIGRLLRRVEP